MARTALELAIDSARPYYLPDHTGYSPYDVDQYIAARNRTRVMSECRPIAEVFIPEQQASIFICIDPDEPDGDAYIGWSSQTMTTLIPKEAREEIGKAILLP